jgi:hypothetical protein
VGEFPPRRWGKKGGEEKTYERKSRDEKPGQIQFFSFERWRVAIFPNLGDYRVTGTRNATFFLRPRISIDAISLPAEPSLDYIG